MINLYIFIGSIIFIFIYIIFAVLLYQKRNDERYKITNHFAFELWIKRDQPNFFLNAFLFISLAAFASNFILNSIYDFSFSSIASSVFAVIIAFSLGAIFYLPLSKFKEKCVFSILFFVSNAALNGLLIFKEVRYIRVYEDMLIFIPLALSVIIVSICIFNMFNPKLFNFNAERDENDNMIRPKIFHLAFGEWLLILTFLLSQVILIFNY